MMLISNSLFFPSLIKKLIRKHASDWTNINSVQMFKGINIIYANGKSKFYFDLTGSGKNACYVFNV